MPTLRRNVTALALAPKGQKRWYLIDCGEATQHQLLRTRLSVLHLRAVFITHVHGDHCYGLPGLLASAATMGRTEALDIVAPAEIEHFIKAVCKHTLLTLPYALRFHHVESLQVFRCDDYAVRATELSHRVPSFAYVFAENARPARLDSDKLSLSGLPPGPLWGQIEAGTDVRLDDGRTLIAQDYLIPVQSRRIIIGGDNDTPERLADAAGGVDLLVHEATYTSDVAKEVGPGPQHSSAASVAAFAQRVGIPNLILTHFSKRYHQSAHGGLEALQREAETHYRGRLFLANDLDVYELQKNGSVELCRVNEDGS